MHEDDLGAAATPMIQRCHDAMRKEVDELSVEDLRLLIGQGVALRWLVPVAVGLVAEEPFISGGLFAGDLLSALGSLPESHWATDTASWLTLRGVAEQIASAGQQAAAWLGRTRGGA